MSSGHAHDQGAKGFLRYMAHLPSMWRSNVNDAVVSELNPVRGETLVDIGSGMGSAIVPAAMTGASVIAVEPTGYMRRILAVRRLAQRARANIEILPGTAEKLPIDSGSVSAVMAVNSIHHWADQQAAVAEISRVLKPGGRVLLVDEDFSDPSHPDGQTDEHDHHFDEADVDVIVEAMTAAGLTPIDCGPARMAEVPVLRFGAVKPTTPSR